MNLNKFLSAETLVVLPTRRNPKVYLAIDNPKVAKLSFELYNPFSNKAKLLKSVSKWLCIHCNALTKILLPTIHVKKSDFVTYLETLLGKELISSVYLATEKDKVVLQLQENNTILGYLKFPLTLEGKGRLLNEIKAIEILSKRDLVPALLLHDNYNGIPFLFLQNLKGSIETVSPEVYKTILERFKKGKSFRLQNHPRVLGLKKKLKEFDLCDLIIVLEKTISKSKNTYLEVYEHGDFAPWNLVATKKGLIPFDFEYFVEEGLDHLDEIKYHFQIEHLLHHKQGKDLISAIISKTPLEEFKVIFTIFLLKEIAQNYQSGKSIQPEQNLLRLLKEEVLK